MARHSLIDNPIITNPINSFNSYRLLDGERKTSTFKDLLTPGTEKRAILRKNVNPYRTLKGRKEKSSKYISCPDDRSCRKKKLKTSFKCDSETRKLCPSLCKVCVKENVCCSNMLETKEESNKKSTTLKESLDSKNKNKNSRTFSKSITDLDTANNESELNKPHNKIFKDESGSSQISFTNKSFITYVTCKDEPSCEDRDFSIKDNVCNEDQRKLCPSYCKVCLSENTCCKVKKIENALPKGDIPVTI